MTLYILSAFSLNMLPISRYGQWIHLYIKEIDIPEAREILARYKDFVSAVGHQSTADLLSKLLGVKVPVNRTMVQLKGGDKAIVCQLFVRLQEGQVLSYEELLEMYETGKIKLVYVEVSEVFY